MWALVESGSVSKIYTRPKQLTLGDVQYPSNIFNMWTSSELEAIGIYDVVIDNTNYKDPEYYINTNQSFAFGSGKVTATYGTATALPLDNILFTAQDETDGLGTEGKVKQVYTRDSLKLMGLTSETFPDLSKSDLWLSNTQLITVWPSDPDLKLVGEDIYFGENPMDTLKPINENEIPDYYKLN